MDRNLVAAVVWVAVVVALRKESVDRNLGNNPEINIGDRSLSARRAWIEITVSVISHCI